MIGKTVKCIRLSLMLAMFCCIIAGNGYAEDTIRIGTFDFPPYFEVSENNEPGGLLVDLLKQILDRLEKKYTLTNYPPKRLFANLVDGKTDLSIIGRRLESENIKGVLYSNNPVSTIVMKVYTRKGTALPENKDGIVGKRVITIRGFNYAGLITQIIPDPANSHLAAFRKLQVGRADYMLNYELIEKNILKDHPFPDIQGRVISSIDAYFAVSEKLPGAEKFLNDVVKAFNELKSEGRIGGI